MYDFKIKDAAYDVEAIRKEFYRGKGLNAVKRLEKNLSLIHISAARQKTASSLFRSA